jgi:hypothetical protein
MKPILYFVLAFAVSAAYAGATTDKPASASRQPIVHLESITDDDNSIGLTEDDGPIGVTEGDDPTQEYAHGRLWGALRRWVGLALFPLVPFSPRSLPAR